MKIILLIILVLIQTVFSALRAAAPTNRKYIVGLSSYYTPADSQLVFNALLTFILDGVATGDTVELYDAFRLQPVARFVIPPGKVFESNPKGRAMRMQREIAATKQYLTTQTLTNDALRCALKAPEFLGLVGRQLRTGSEPVHVILIGLQVYASVEEPSMSTLAAYPSDAHLTADSRLTPFSIVEKRGTLTGVTVHIAYLHESFVNDYHKERLARFMALFCTGQEGVLATWASNPGLAFQRAKENVSNAVVNAAIDANDSKLEMRQVALRVVPNWLPAAVPSLTNSTAVGSSASLVSLPATTKDTLGVGLIWGSDCDFDLYVRPGPHDAELSFSRTATAQGRYFRDLRTRTSQRDYEYVELNGPIDLRNVSAWVNFFSGRTKSADGVVVVHYQGRTYQSRFHIGATSGNQGIDASRRAESKHWAEIDLRGIVGMSQ